MPPGHVQSLDDYSLWLEQIIAASGGYLDDDILSIYPLEDANGEFKGFRIRQQRVNFWNDTFLAFALIVDENLEQVRYSYHYQRRGGALILPEGQRPLPSRPSAPGRPHAAEPFDEVDLEEALAEVGKFITGTMP